MPAGEEHRVKATQEGSSPRLSRTLKLATTGWAVCAAALAFFLKGRAEDDFFITYRYAQNLATSRGFVFNPGERVSGTTEPGLGLLLALMKIATGLPIPTLGTIVSAASAVLIAACVAWEVADSKSGRLAAVLGGSLWVLSPFLWIHQGAAAPLALAMLTLAVLLEPKKPVIAGCFAGIAVWCRPDAGLGVVLIVLLEWAGRRRFPRAFAAFATLMIALGLALATGYFGDPLPGTLGVKRTLSEISSVPRTGIHFWSSGWPLWKRTAGPWPFASLVAMPAAWVALAKVQRRVPRLLGWNALGLTLAYPLLGVPFMNWYALPCLVATFFGLPLLAVELWPKGRNPGAYTGWLRRGGTVGAGAIVLSLFIGSARWLSDPPPPPRLKLYRQAAGWLSTHAQPGDLVAHTEVGTLGYFSDLRMLDLAGLVSPELVGFIRRGDYRGIVSARSPRFVLLRGDRSRLSRMASSPWFQTRYREAAIWIGEREERLVAYEQY